MMDAVDWVVIGGLFLLLWLVSASFRVGIKWGAAATFVLAVSVIAIRPEVLDALPGIVNALVRQ